MVDENFRKIFFENYTLVTVNVLYHLPDWEGILQEFIWQTLDLSPQYPRVRRFLKFWRREIDAKIKEVHIAEVAKYDPKWRHGIILNLD